MIPGDADWLSIAAASVGDRRTRPYRLLAAWADRQRTIARELSR